jgi:8-oxo-dGTP diphosphatase
MLKYTICFIKRGNEILMLNRESSSWMGMWNGVGGKLKKHETPLQSILREVKEETGISLTDVEYKGNVTWEVNASYSGGMYAYLAELSTTYEYPTPIKMEEGILDWKNIDWLLHPENLGVANLKCFLPIMLNDSYTYNHRFIYEGNEVKDFQSIIIEEPITVK